MMRMTRILKGLTTIAGTVGIVVLYKSDRRFAVVGAAKKEPATQGWSFHQPTVPWDSNWDKREPETLLNPKKSFDCDSEERKNALEKVSATSSRHLFLIRHGQYCMDTTEDSEKFLTSLGKQQAEHTGERLKEFCLPFDRIIYSTMTRATETANIISKYLPDVPMISSDMIREGAPIPPEPPVGHWHPEAQFYEDGARIEAAFRKHFHRADASQQCDSYEVLVCHANVIRYFVCRALQFPPEAWLRFTVHNCSVTWLTIHASGRVILRALGDSGHIPAEKLTTN